jgi:hypothetical protein
MEATTSGARPTRHGSRRRSRSSSPHRPPRRQIAIHILLALSQPRPRPRPCRPWRARSETRPRVTQAMDTEARSSAAALRRPPPPLLLCSWRAGELRRSSRLGAGHVSKLDLNFLMVQTLVLMLWMLNLDVADMCCSVLQILIFF